MTQQATAPEPKRFDCDNFVELLAHLTEYESLSFPITLIVGGLFVCGVTITSKEYFRKLADDVKAKGSSESEDVKRTFESFLDSVAEIASKPPKETMSEASERGHYPRFLHLMEVTIYSATGQTTTMEDLLWRIRIDKIDGFSMGTLNQAEEERVA